MYSLLTNASSSTLYNELTHSLKECNQFFFNVAFINYSGLQLLLDALKTSEENNIKGHILTGTYLNFTDPQALRKLTEFKTIESRVFVTTAITGFHPKAYIFEYDTYYKVIVGSSNITQSALKSNIEWNLKIVTKDTPSEEDESFISNVLDSFHEVWNRSEENNEEFLQAYENFKAKNHEHVQEVSRSYIFKYNNSDRIIANEMQKQAVSNLEFLRKRGQSKALIVAATGTGKTYLSAFDVKKAKPNRVLFLAHQENILKKSLESFEKVLYLQEGEAGLYSGSRKDTEARYLFSTIQMMNREYSRFDSDSFDYIIIDEAHRAASPTYRKVMEYFRPQFLLGMTATPERTDGVNLHELFDHNVAVDIRLRDALKNDLLVPFHYFGITDIDSIDLSNVRPNDITTIAKKLMINQRVDFIIEKMDFYAQDGVDRRGLGFCATIEHAEYMAREFNKRGIPSIILSGRDSVEAREQAIKRLEERTDPLQFIFTVDIFNEGIDIPTVNIVLMLRPTQSPIIFTQQLGRGLRKAENKEFLTVLDFIGNHQSNFLLAIALHGSKVYDKDSLKTSVEKGFTNLPGSSHIQLDEISKERILEQLDKENFNSLEHLKNNYFEFKSSNNGQIVWYLEDYLYVDSAPDPTHFFVKAKNYLEFLSKVEKNNQRLLAHLSDENWMSVLNYLSGMLPIKRIHEFVIIKVVMENDDVTFEDIKRECLKYLEETKDEIIVHAINRLLLEFADKRELKTYPRLIEEKNGKWCATNLFRSIFENEDYRLFLTDVIQYGIQRYTKEFGHKNYGVPHFKLYEEYSMIDIAVLSNYEKIHSSFRGSGVLRNPEINHYFLFNDLHKDEDIESRLQYQDKFINRQVFQWESSNTTRLNSDRGKDLTHPQEREAVIHLFVRKFREIDRVVSKFIYVGTGTPTFYQNEKPIKIHYQLEEKIPKYLAEEFEVE